MVDFDMPLVSGLGESVHSRPQRLAAFGLCLALSIVALIAVRFGSLQEPVVMAFLPIAATIWALADLMTAFLLLAQFYVNGTRGFTVVAAAYGISGLLTWPYLLAFPGMFESGNVADSQISVWLWAIWHGTFPAIVAIGALLDPKLKLRTLSRVAMQNAVLSTIAVTFAVSTVIAAIVYAERSALPPLIVSGALEPTFRYLVAPTVGTLNAVACAMLLLRGKKLTTLHLWLIVAMFTGMLDCILNSASPARFSFGWYVGKFETMMTSSVVLAILLVEVTGLYRRLATMAIIDPLTGLFNRRALEDHMHLVLSHAKRNASGLGLLVIDVDFFKGYNDTYGHAGGDECLRQIATILKTTATRPLDHVARYGGEEFVVLVPDTPLEGAIALAERILERVEDARVPYTGYSRGHVTVSVGVSFTADARNADGKWLFETADRALYEAKERGRNSFVCKTCAPTPPKTIPLASRRAS